MYSVEYWLRRDETADRVRFNEAEINTFNKDNLTRLAKYGYLYHIANLDCVLGYGVCVKRAIIYQMPGHRVALSAIYVNEPIVVLAYNGEWAHICCVYYEGWVESKCIGLFSTKSQWLRYCDMKDFLLITAEHIDVSTSNTYTEGQLPGTVRLDMGVKVLMSYKKNMIRLPVRDSKGYIMEIEVDLPTGSDVRAGYMPYTGANVIKQAFKCLERPYGWAGTKNSRDCSSLIMDIHRCFGLIMPRDVKGQALMCGCRTLRFEEECDWDFLRCGDIVGWRAYDRETGSHTMIYLGDAGERYVLSAVGGTYQTCMINDIMQLRDNGKSWKDSANYAKLLRW